MGDVLNGGVGAAAGALGGSGIEAGFEFESTDWIPANSSSFGRTCERRKMAVIRASSSASSNGLRRIGAAGRPCPAVKACCIEELCKLGYFTPDFVAHVKAACADENLVAAMWSGRKRPPDNGDAAR